MEWNCDQQVSSDVLTIISTVHCRRGLLLVLLPSRGNWSKTHPGVLVIMKFSYAKMEKLVNNYDNVTSVCVVPDVPKMEESQEG